MNLEADASQKRQSIKALVVHLSGTHPDNLRFCNDMSKHLLLAQVDALVEALAPEEAVRSKQRQPVEATRHNIALLFRELDQNVLADLAPKRGARYGKIDPADEGQIADALAAMHRTVQELQAGESG